MDRITNPAPTQRLTSPPSSPTSWLKTNTGPMFPKDREPAIRGERPRYDWVYDQAVNATHDKLNGVMRTQLDVWHCPKTNGTQHILHASSHIVDTPTRQRIARWYNKSYLESRDWHLVAKVEGASTTPRSDLSGVVGFLF
ncbi:unnamed protein product [Symbiodinium sp. CCMP2592]|nr:unnamed protein product [Symbiodinium sp. CCMP2592]